MFLEKENKQTTKYYMKQALYNCCVENNQMTFFTGNKTL